MTVLVLDPYITRMKLPAILKVKLDVRSSTLERVIDRISEFIGDWRDPEKKLLAVEKKCEADLVRARTDIKLEELGVKHDAARVKRAQQRWLAELHRNQDNMESVAEKTLPLLNDSARPEEVDSDWIANFFKQARQYSNSEMQQLFAYLLAQQFNNPGSIARRTVNAVACFEPADASLFQRLAGFVVRIENSPFPLIFRRTSYYKERGLTFEHCLHLASLGLISTNDSGYSQTLTLPTQPEGWFLNLQYQERRFRLLFSERAERIDIGRVLLTDVGRQIYAIAEPSAVRDFPDFLTTRFGECGLQLDEILSPISSDSNMQAGGRIGDQGF
ncbi:MAG: DUF2806 domain-containing protein [Phycisphaerae bacterium]|nr:DUF2806 domain-containing protein [Phycisphaerae bacterium]